MDKAWRKTPRHWLCAVGARATAILARGTTARPCHGGAMLTLRWRCASQGARRLTASSTPSQPHRAPSRQQGDRAVGQQHRWRTYVSLSLVDIFTALHSRSAYCISFEQLVRHRLAALRLRPDTSADHDVIRRRSTCRGNARATSCSRSLPAIIGRWPLRGGIGAGTPRLCRSISNLPPVPLRDAKSKI
jgi:hypothetical protein